MFVINSDGYYIVVQYFYTIKDLREAVLPMSKLDLKENGKLTDEDLKKHRVGGRLVTRREIVRSRQCPYLSFLPYLV